MVGATKSSAGADFPCAQTHLILHHSSQLILLSHPPLKRHTERSWNTANVQSAIKNKTPPRPFLPICSLWHKVGLIQITLLSLGSLLSIMHVCLQCSLKHPGKKSKGYFTWQIFYTALCNHFILSDGIFSIFVVVCLNGSPPHRRHLSACKRSCEHWKDVKLHTLHKIFSCNLDVSVSLIAGRQTFSLLHKKVKISEKWLQLIFQASNDWNHVYNCTAQIMPVL